MNKVILTIVGFSLAACISQAYANTTDLTLKSAPDYSPDGEAVLLKTNHGKFIFQRATLSDAANQVLMNAKKNSCLTIGTQGALTEESNIQSVTNCKKVGKLATQSLNSINLIIKKSSRLTGSGENVVVGTNRGKFIFDSMAMHEKDRWKLNNAKEGDCLTIVSKIPLSSGNTQMQAIHEESLSIQSVSSCRN